jgi:uncharacterized protein YfbU (UPF0304 family)
MNADRYSRVTLVLDRSTDEALTYLSKRLRQSKSELVREVLVEPVQAMQGVLQLFPDDQDIDPRQLALAGLDAIESVIGGPIELLREKANG